MQSNVNLTFSCPNAKQHITVIDHGITTIAPSASTQAPAPNRPHELSKTRLKQTSIAPRSSNHHPTSGGRITGSDDYCTWLTFTCVGRHLQGSAEPHRRRPDFCPRSAIREVSSGAGFNRLVGRYAESSICVAFPRESICSQTMAAWPGWAGMRLCDASAS